MVTRNATCVTRPTKMSAGERNSRLSIEPRSPAGLLCIASVLMAGVATSAITHLQGWKAGAERTVPSAPITNALLVIASLHGRLLRHLLRLCQRGAHTHLSGDGGGDVVTDGCPHPLKLG